MAPLRDAEGAPRWIPRERWHVTLLFLGTVADDRVAPLCDAAGPPAAASPSMSVRIAGGGRFGSLRRPQVAWAGLAGDVEPLTDLAGRLAAAARSLRLPVEDRPFRAHLTLGRWRPRAPADGALVDRLAGYRGPEWPVRELQLLRSQLGPAPRYEQVAGWPLG